MRLCDIIQHHNFCKCTVELKLIGIKGGGSQACRSQPIGADLVFRGRGLTTECFRHWVLITDNLKLKYEPNNEHNMSSSICMGLDTLISILCPLLYCLTCSSHHALWDVNRKNNSKLWFKTISSSCSCMLK